MMKMYFLTMVGGEIYRKFDNKEELDKYIDSFEFGSAEFEVYEVAYIDWQVRGYKEVTHEQGHEGRDKKANTK